MPAPLPRQRVRSMSSKRYGRMSLNSLLRILESSRVHAGRGDPDQDVVVPQLRFGHVAKPYAVLPSITLDDEGLQTVLPF
jgi:hypothetical protein